MGCARGIAVALLAVLFLPSCHQASMLNYSQSESNADGTKVTRTRLKLMQGKYAFTRNDVTVSSNDPMQIADDNGVFRIYQMDVDVREVLLSDKRNQEHEKHALLDVSWNRIVRMRIIDDMTVEDARPEDWQWFDEVMHAASFAIAETTEHPARTGDAGAPGNR